MSLDDGDCELAVTRVNDDREFVDWLFEMKLHDTTLSPEATDNLAQKCIAKFDDADAALECRAVSLYTVVAQIRAGNTPMLAYVPDICRRLKSRSVLSQRLTDPGAEEFHLQIITAISVILDTSPETFVDEAFGPVLHYLAQKVSCERTEVAAAACKFWAKHAVMSANLAIREHWMRLLLPEMSVLIKALMDQMSYHPVHAEYLQHLGSTNTAERDKSLPVVETFANLRNFATVAFEHIARVYPADLVCTTFRPLLEERIESDSWTEKEAAILALATFTHGAGTPDAMLSSYALVVPRVVECYNDPHPLLRSVACLTMPTLVGRQLYGVKTVLTLTARATRDSNAEVRMTAIRALSTLFAYRTPGAGTKRFGAHTARLVDALERAGKYDMDCTTRCAYFECVSHLVWRAGDSLTAAHMDRLIPPLIEAWRSQSCDSTVDGQPGGSSVDPNLGIVPLSVSLGTVATHGKFLYEPFAECVFAKVCADIEGYNI